MAQAPVIYDLLLMLDTAAPEDQREQVLATVERIIGAGGGAIANRQDWGPRQTAYEIRHKTDADYQLLQFHGPPEIPANLNRTLRITDGIVRFRLIKLAPGTPAPPMSRPEPRPTGIVDEPVPAAAAAPADEPAAAAAAE